MLILSYYYKPQCCENCVDVAQCLVSMTCQNAKSQWNDRIITSKFSFLYSSV